MKIPRTATSRNGMIATQHYEATAAGAEILEMGGNAVDAAVAAAFALGVCEPAASGLGGQTMMLVYDASRGRTVALDGSSRAPHRAVPGLVSKKERLHGYRATTVPSTPATLEYARANFGTMDIAPILAPAIRLAERGYRFSVLQRELTERETKKLQTGNIGAWFLDDTGRPLRTGTRVRMPMLAETMRRLAAKGIDDFYRGGIARRIHEDMVKNGGLVRDDDLAQIPWPIERSTVSCRFAGLRVRTMPPPGAGRTLIEMLNVISDFPRTRWTSDSVKGALLLAEVTRRGLLDRRDRPFEPNYYPQVQTKLMLSEEYAHLIADQVRSRLRHSGETTHLSVMDRWGNAVALTQSIERVYGACVATDDLGFLYNNYMSAFEYTDISHPYYLHPNAVPWASVAPTIVFSNRKPWIVVGSPGSQRIVSSIMQVLLRIVNGQEPLDAVSAPRLHCSLDGKVSIEASRMPDEILPSLRKHGYKIDVRRAFSFYLGCVQLVMLENGRFTGVADPRRDGSAAAPLS